MPLFVIPDCTRDVDALEHLWYAGVVNNTREVASCNMSTREVASCNEFLYFTI